MDPRSLTLCYLLVLLNAFSRSADAAPKHQPKGPTIIDSTGKSAAILQAEGWSTSRPPYPVEARIRGEQGSMDVEIITGKNGRVVKASVPKSRDHPILDVFIARWAYARWSGPSNHRLVVPVTFLAPLGR